MLSLIAHNYDPHKTQLLPATFAHIRDYLSIKNVEEKKILKRNN